MKYGHNSTVLTFSAKSSKLCGNFSKTTLTCSISKKHNETKQIMKKFKNRCVNMGSKKIEFITSKKYDKNKA